MNNYKYIVDENADEPIMLLNREIGQEDGMVSGADFQEQLMYLDSLGKKRIQVWINSVGGSVVDSYNIYNAILKSNTPVDTYNVGICASMAGAIFMAGRKRIMSDYAKLMMHPVQGSTDTKAYQSFMNSISEMISAKSNLSAEEVTNMMQSTTWLGAEECIAKNLCTSIEKTTDSNKKYLPNETNLLLEYSNKLIEDLFINKKTNKKMIQVTNKLNLNADASEQSILDAINKMQMEKEDAMSQKNEIMSEKETLMAELEMLKEKQVKIETMLAEMESEKETMMDEMKMNKATEMVKSYQNKIGDKEDTVAKWVSQAKNNFDLTKELLESLPLNVVSNKIDVEEVKVQAKTAHSIMLDIQNKLKNKN